MTAADVAGWLTRLEETHAAATPGPDSGKPVTDDERSSLRIDGLWTDEPYPEYSQAEVLRAYRLGAEDQRFQVSERMRALPQLVAAVRAVIDLHKSVVNWAEPECEACSAVCRDDECLSVVPWPCPTVAAVVSALGAEVTGR